MKKHILGLLFLSVAGTCLTSCGDDFFDTKNYSGVDVDNGLTDASSVSHAVNGEYDWFYHYYFAGDYATMIGDIPTDLSYWNGSTKHMDAIYSYTMTDEESYLHYIWNYGYKVIDNSARAINAGKKLYETSTEEDKKTLDVALAEAYALRAYAKLALVNIYGHQIKVNGQDFSDQPGIVISEEPIKAFEQVSRSTVGGTYTSIVADLKDAIEHFGKAGADRGKKVYFTKAAAEGLLARVYLYMENWSDAASYAQQALDDAGVSAIATTADEYKAMYSSTGVNTESLFYLSIDDKHNWSAYSCGTLWSTYSFSPSPKLQKMYGANDCRTSIFIWDASSTPTKPAFKGGKFPTVTTTNYLINAPEMYLIKAEAKLHGTTAADFDEARNSLLVVAKRNADITSAEQLGTTKDEVLAFLKDERARELFQEGLRLYDLRRWDEKASVYAYGAPEVKFTFNNYKISDFVYPIPVDEINSGFGVAQNDWSKTLPKAN